MTMNLFLENGVDADESWRTRKPVLQTTRATMSKGALEDDNDSDKKRGDR